MPGVSAGLSSGRLFFGRYNLVSDSGRFASISGGATEESSQSDAIENKGNLIVPNLEDVLKYSSDFISPRDKKEFEEGLGNLYQKK